MADQGYADVTLASREKEKRSRFAENIALVRSRPTRHLMILFVAVWAIIFHYIPIWGITVAFKRYYPIDGFWGGQWIGFKYFVQFFTDVNAWRLIRNTVVLGFYGMVFGFPMPIVFALLLNEVRHTGYKRIMQSFSYLPHFVSVVVVVGLIYNLVNYDGMVTLWIARMTGSRPAILTNPDWFRPLYIGSGIWQSLGWGSIIYLATLSGISQELYEAADIDGAGRFRKVISVTIPALLPTIMILFILNTRNIVRVGFEKAFLMQNPATYSKSDIIATYVYRRGIEMGQYSYAAAVGLMNSVVGFLIVFLTNYIVKKVRGEGLW